MSNHKIIRYVALLLTMVLLLPSCSKHHDNPSKDNDFDKRLVINELMASNRTGLQTKGGKTSDWIEIRNISDKPLKLKGYWLASEKKKTVSVAKSDSDSIPLTLNEIPLKYKNFVPDSVETVTEEWEFPDVTLNPGECVLVFADKSGKDKKKKSKKVNKDGELHATFKLPAQNGTVRLLSPDWTILSQVVYDDLSADQAYARLDDGTYEKTYFPTPGHSNDREGYEKYCAVIDGQYTGALKIWEVMSRMHHKSENWIEFKNTSADTVNLNEYSVTTKMKDGKQFALPDVKLAPGKVIAFQTAGDKAENGNARQIPFKLGGSESLLLLKDGKPVDGVCAKGTVLDTSIGRVEGRKGLFYFARPTFGGENTSSPYRYIARQPAPDSLPGIYSKAMKMVLHLNTDGRTVHYTLDGSWPGPKSPVYKDSIVINSTTVVRAYAEGDSTTLNSNVMTATYLLGVDHKMPVISISVNPDDLYDYKHGIYVKGPGYTEEWPHNGANYWMPWTKRAHVEMYDGNEGFTLDCGLKIFGGFSRAEDKKSFTVKFGNEYGASSYTYDYFDLGHPLELNDLVLRSGSQDWKHVMVRDEFFTSLMAEQCPTLLVQAYRPVVVYINGGYFGIYYIREKIDRHFVARHLGVTDKAVTVLMSKSYEEEGSNTDYNALLAYIRSHDLSKKECYDYVRDRVDLQGLIDHKLGEIYASNVDVGNVRYVRSQDPNADKKWYFVYYDIDLSWFGVSKPAAFYLKPQSNVTEHNIMVYNLLRNKDFRQLFLERLSFHLHHTFSQQNTTAVFNGLVEKIKPEMERNCKRWPQLSFGQWQKNVEEFRNKFATRQKAILNDLRKELAITPDEEKRYFADLGY